MAPKLRVAVAPDMRDWRQHLEAAHAHMGTLAAAWPDVRCGLGDQRTALAVGAHAWPCHVPLA